ncbi:hypothetical protein PsYK624_146030 [Phanerochaete sordida]|uniref:Uncharacterized protein n=1 Tax=Phanerochaete sordida TaxID=48140 RepID=A0A9P3GS37_9APHY|nr:hypothetical protein PsYK624_146030 [Phanerochaete sordida]
MSAYPDEATLVPKTVMPPRPALAVRPAAANGTKPAKTAAAKQPAPGVLTQRCVAACARKHAQIAREGPTPPGCSDDWFWHDNAHSQRRRQASVEGGTPVDEDRCYPRWGVWCSDVLVGKQCRCDVPKEPPVFEMEV